MMPSIRSKRTATQLFLFLLAATIWVAGCRNVREEADPPPSPPLDEPAPALESSSPSQAVQSEVTLPPPLIVTIPADRIDITIDTDAAAGASITTQGGVTGGLVQFEDGLPPEVDEMLQKIYRGEYAVDTTGQDADALPATYTYSDMNGDGIDDLVIILVVDTGEFTSVTAGSTHGVPVIQIIPREEPGTVVDGLSIPVDELLAMSGSMVEGESGEGAYLITLGPEDIARWSQPFLPE